MFEPLDDSLRKIARGAGIALIGVTSGLLFNFIARLIIARYGLQANYGIFSLALAVFSIAAILASLGLRQGATRYIAYFRGKGDMAKVHETISTSIKLSTIASIVLSLVIFFTAEAIALKLFHTPDLALPLKIFAVGIPFFTLILVLGSLFRGFDRGRTSGNLPLPYGKHPLPDSFGCCSRHFLFFIRAAWPIILIE